ncbi:MAG: DUF1592 domain-containing protein [Abitibacteriaceae bacterium]|nr:DUF1592 domain-containing protein [Abditibacteriaceae bacterium]MBV9867403.1 DUF1592 domain-containing protein [Abditibacteriaceae bacterium]
MHSKHFPWGRACLLVTAAPLSVAAVRAAAPHVVTPPPHMVPLTPGATKVTPQHTAKAVKAAKAANPGKPISKTAASHGSKVVPIHTFLESHCFDCHDSETKKGGLDLATLKFNLADPQTFPTWVKVYDRVHAGEMPPKSVKLPTVEREGFTKTLAAALTTAEQKQLAAEGATGRTVWRRLNRYEYENTLRDVLQAPWLQLRDMLPEDGLAFRFNKVGEALDVSHVQMARYLSAADYALRQVLATQAKQPETKTTRYYTREERAFYGAFDVGPEVRSTFPVLGSHADEDFLLPAYKRRKGVEKPPSPEPPTVGAKDPQRREQEGVGVVLSTYEPTEIHWGRFRAPVSGRYKLRFLARSVWIGPKPDKQWWIPDYSNISAGRRIEPITIYGDRSPRILRKLGSFDVGPEPVVKEMDVWLLQGESIRPDAARFFRPRPGDMRNPWATPEGAPGVSFQWMEAEGPLYYQWPTAGHKLLFGDLPILPMQSPTGTPAPAGAAPTSAAERYEVVSTDPQRDAPQLLHNFLGRVYRRPVTDEEVTRFLPVVQRAMAGGYSFQEAMLAGYTAVLCSPGFLYLDENPGRLDTYALASRLSYFLWNSPPDDTLLALASSGQLRRPEVLKAQTDRLLDDEKSRRFVEAFLDYWLDLRKINANDADVELYPDYQLDDLLVESSVAETQSFFGELLHRDLGVKNLVSSDFAMLNERLATHYGIPNAEKDVSGVALRRVELPPDSPRGGLLTQASVLKITANGTTTSPVLRGVWVMERILGDPASPPPPNVGAIEPDIRGATTIREQLDKHRHQESCAVCHRKIDPAGFALESFDVMGGWRDYYRATGQPKKTDDKGESATVQHVAGVGHNGRGFTFYTGPAVDASGQLPDGHAFKNVRDLKALLAQDDRKLARNLTKQLLIYATGAPVRFADRAKVDAILDHAQPGGYGVRTLVHEIVQSDLFQNK